MKAKEIYILFECDSFISCASFVFLGAYTDLIKLKGRLKLENLNKEEINELMTNYQISLEGNGFFIKKVILNKNYEIL